MQKVEISVITPTVRFEGLPLIEKALKQQTHTSWEWVIGSREKPTNLTIPFVWVKDKKPDGGSAWTLNWIYNRMVEKSKGKLLISWQDWTYAKPDTLETFWQHYLDEPKTLVSAVGNKYETDTWNIMLWKDPRERNDLGSYHSCYFNEVEYNLCSVPREAIYAVGGWDEGLDKYFGMDGYSVSDRINDLGGYDFKLDQSIKSYSLQHGRPPGWEEKNAIHGPYEERKRELKLQGKWPVLDFLKVG